MRSDRYASRLTHHLPVLDISPFRNSQCNHLLACQGVHRFSPYYTGKRLLQANDAPAYVVPYREDTLDR